MLHLRSQFMTYSWLSICLFDPNAITQNYLKVLFPETAEIMKKIRQYNYFRASTVLWVWGTSAALLWWWCHLEPESAAKSGLVNPTLPSLKLGAAVNHDIQFNSLKCLNKSNNFWLKIYVMWATLNCRHHFCEFGRFPICLHQKGQS